MRIDREFATHELERLFQSIALHIDAQPVDLRTRFMCKAFMLLAQGSGDVSLAIDALHAAAETSCAEGRSAE